MLSVIITILVLVSATLEAMSYYRQVAKSIELKDTRQVSTSAYLYKLYKYGITLLVLCLSQNWIGLTLECFATICCIIALTVVCHYKPKEWSLFQNSPTRREFWE